MKNPLSILLVSVFAFAGLATGFAQAPTSLTDFSGKVIRFQATTNPLGGVLVGALIRITPTNSAPFTNGTALLSGQLFTTGDPTNVFYAQLATDRAQMRLQSIASGSFRATNEVTMTFFTATNGVYTNVVTFSSNPQRQTNSIGVFTVSPGTNAVPAVDFIIGGGIVQSGASPALSGSANGFALKYQWRLNGTNVPTATNANYTVAGITAATAGDYTWVVTNEVGAVTSSVVNLTIASPIVILQQPQSQTVMIGSYLNLTFAATGSIQNFNWLLDGNLANGVNNQTNYTIAQISQNQAGKYSVFINGYGTSTNTANAVITVQNGGVNSTWLGRPFVKIADDRSMPVPGVAGQVFTNWVNSAYTPLLTFRDGKVHFVAGTSAGVRSLFRWTNGVLTTLVFTNTSNPLGGYFSDVFYPTDEGNGLVNFSGNSVVNGGMFAYSSGGISNLINANTIAPGRIYPFGGPGSYGRRNNGVAISAALFSSPGSFNIVGTGMYFHDGTNLTRLCDDTTDLPGALTGYAGRPTANSVNFDGTNVVFSSVTGGGPGGFFKSTPGGVITKLADYTDPLPENPSLMFSKFGDLDIDGGMIFGLANGGIYAFETNGVAANVGSGLALSAAGPRTVYYHSGSYLYRWQDGVTEVVLNAPNLVDGKNVSSIVAMDGQGDDVAVLLKFTDNSYGIYLVSGPVSALPVITSEPLDFNVIENGNASFYVSAAGQGPLSYQWFKNSAPLEFRTNSSISLAVVQAGDVGGYSVIVSNFTGSVTSRVAQLTRTIPTVPMILSGPLISPSTPVFGSNATITVTAAGQNIGYTWYKNGGVFPGANTNFIALSNIGAAERTNYFVVITNSASAVTSSVAILNVAPVITQQPVSVTNVVGASASFTVAANGIAPLTYQWRKGSGTPTTVIGGATSTTLNFPSIALTDALNYRVTVSHAGGSGANSQTVKLTVLNATLPNSPTLTSPAVANGQFQFLLPTQTGYSYRVESKTNLIDLTWTLEQNIPGDGTVKLVTVDATAAQKWVRVMAQ